MIDERSASDYVLRHGDEVTMVVGRVRNAAEVFADGTAWPEIMMPEEVVRALRLDELNGGDMAKGLRALTRLTDDRRLIRAAVYAGPNGGRRVYTIEAVRAFIRGRGSV